MFSGLMAWMAATAGLARRFDADVHRTPAERAAADRTWAFGHVIVDEAQELSPMAWRTLMRRCPAKSMTIVGDFAQTGDISGSGSWSESSGSGSSSGSGDESGWSSEVAFSRARLCSVFSASKYSRRCRS